MSSITENIKCTAAFTCTLKPFFVVQMNCVFIPTHIVVKKCQKMNKY